MKKTLKIITFIIAITTSLNFTYGLFTTSSNFKNNFYSESYNIKIDGSGGKFISTANVVIQNDEIVLPIPEKSGYKFLGYSEDKNGTVNYDNTIKDISKINDKKIYAQWEKIIYSISYNLNGGSISNNPKNYNVESNSFTLPTPTRTGYTFTGWTGSNGTTPSLNVTVSKGTTGNLSYIANWKTDNYSITYNLNGGSISNNPKNYNVESNSFTLPTPTRTGYTFTGWTGSNGTTPSLNVTVSKGTTGNLSYIANWRQNYYTVRYYVNNNLWATRSVGYGNAIENLNAQSSLDIYHTFHGWNGWVSNMPNYDVNLYANITESYCMLMTGHGPYANATGLLKVFQNAGWTGRVEEAPSAPGNYWVVTDYTLTRAQAEQQKQYIAANTNYKNYNYPYLYWVAVSCTNGYSESWTRSLGQSTFN